jgi:hypothetical protein
MIGKKRKVNDNESSDLKKKEKGEHKDESTVRKQKKTK